MNKQCDKCKGTLQVASSQRQGDWQVRYLRCPKCGSSGKSVLPASQIRRRKYFTN